MRVAIYRQQLFVASEPFIAMQASLTPGITPLYAGTEVRGPAPDGAQVFAGAHNRLLQRLTRRNPPLLRWLREQRTQLIHAHFAIDAAYALPLARKLAVPLVTTLWGIDATATRRTLAFSRRLSWLMYLIKRSELRRDGDRFICVSRFIRERALALGFPEASLCLHYAGVDCASFTPNRDRSSSNVILHVARLVEKKGTDDLFHAVAQLPGKLQPELVLIGDGPLRGELTDLAETLGIAPRVRFLGFLPQSEVRRWYERAALLCLPSRTARTGDAEGLPNVLLEAQAMEVPIVATDHGAFHEAVIDGTTGILVPERDRSALASALARVLGDPQEAAAMGRRGRENVLENFNAAVQGEHLTALYRGLLDRG